MTSLQLCKSELDKYIYLITGEKNQITLSVGNSNDLFDEDFEINVKEGKGYIVGSRPRAVLIGIYEFLRRCGCRFIRPGKLGELIPKKKLSELNVVANIQPKNRHRGITIEGAVSLENVLDIIEWAPKVGFNSYFIQFRTAFEFFNRWYSHKSNDTLESEKFDEVDAQRFVNIIVDKIKERDMVYHAVGHGWTSSCVGLDSNGWKDTKIQLSDDKKNLLAEVDGKRDLFKGIPLNTNLCYSNPIVQEKFVSEVVSYAQLHKEIDVLHIWLADDSNNVCECSNCNKKTFADWYVIMLNEIDRRFTELQIPMKICFLVYLDLYWPPKEQTIINEDRFIMMFAPIFRSYSESFDCSKNATFIEYNRNKVVYPHTTSNYVNFLVEWKKIFKGDSFDFDYHLMWDINRDLSGETLARVLFEDVRKLSNLDMNGFMSCQLQRAFYPNGLAFYVLGRSLFDNEISYEELREEYYLSAFGKNCEFAKEFYGKITKYVPFEYITEKINDKIALPLLLEGKKYLDNLKFPMESKKSIYSESLAILKYVAKNVNFLVTEILLKIQNEDSNKIKLIDKRRKKYLNSKEVRFQPYIDGFYVNMILDGFICSKEVGIYAK